MIQGLKRDGYQTVHEIATFVCDDVSDLDLLPTLTNRSDDGKYEPCAAGSIAKVISEGSLYILSTDGEWTFYKNESGGGVTPDISIGTVSTGQPGEDADVTITGTKEAPILNFTIPRGEQGPKGDDGDVTQAQLDEVIDDVSSLKDDLSDIEDTLKTKAEIDGYYEEMTVGDAEQLVATQYVEDSEPYLFRTTGGSADVGNRAYVDAIVGGSVAWNQIANDSSAVSSTSDDRSSLFFRIRQLYTPYTTLVTLESPTVSTYNRMFSTSESFVGVSILHVGKSSNITLKVYDSMQIIANHKYMVSLTFTGVDHTTVGGLSYDDLQIFDLTAMFGSTIADYIYSLEQATAGAGVAFFRKLFPKDYYEYNAGELISVSGLASHDTVGFNQWDEEWRNGYYNQNTGAFVTSANYVANKNLIRVLPNTSYYFNAPTGINRAVFYYDADGNYISRSGLGYVITSFKTPSNCSYIAFYIDVPYGTTYNHDICINLSWSGYRNGEYEPYEKHSYPLDNSLTLRGIPKLDASNNLYYDGDEYASDGSVIRKYGIVDLGTLNWIVQGNGGTYYTNLSDMKQSNSCDLALSANYERLYGVYSSWNDVDKVYGTRNNYNRIYFKDTAYTTVADFKAAMNGVMLVYELATPTTETADPYQQVQICDDFGTEEFVSTSIVPVGHNTKYPANLRDKLQHLPNLASADGIYAIQQTDKQMSLVTIPAAVSELPDAPTTNGDYTLKVTVADGTATYSWEVES